MALGAWLLLRRDDDADETAVAPAPPPSTPMPPPAAWARGAGSHRRHGPDPADGPTRRPKRRPRTSTTLADLDDDTALRPDATTTVRAANRRPHRGTPLPPPPDPAAARCSLRPIATTDARPDRLRRPADLGRRRLPGRGDRRDRAGRRPADHRDRLRPRRVRRRQPGADPAGAVRGRRAGGDRGGRHPPRGSRRPAALDTGRPGGPGGQLRGEHRRGDARPAGRRRARGRTRRGRGQRRRRPPRRAGAGGHGRRRHAPTSAPASPTSSACGRTASTSTPSNGNRAWRAAAPLFLDLEIGVGQIEVRAHVPTSSPTHRAPPARRRPTTRWATPSRSTRSTGGQARTARATRSVPKAVRMAR